MSAAAERGLRRRAMPLITAAAAGALLGAGLLVSGMTQPAKVLAFLDVSGDWNPSLAFVMAGAAAVYAVAFHWLRRGRDAPWFDSVFHLPIRHHVDLPLVVGSALFGIGWGIGGICPGPGLVTAAGGSSAGLAVVAGMVAGMVVQHWLARRYR